jgi:peptidoglycan/LPS O-acetylase OafA/YrhL
MVLLPLVLTPLQPQGDTLRWHLFPFLTFTGNFSYAYFTSMHFAPHMWTISLEEQFYLAVPVLVVFAPALGRSIRWWALGLLLLTVAFRLYVQLNGIKYPMVWVLTPCRMDPFIVGAFCSWVYVSRREWLDRRIGWMLALAGIAGFVLVAQFARLGPSVDVVWQLTVVALSAGCLLLSTVARAGTGPLMSWKPFVFLGKISFGLYVYHWIAITLQYRYLPVSTFGTTPFAWLLTLLIVFGAITLVSVLSYYGYERPFVRLKENYERVKSRPA